MKIGVVTVGAANGRSVFAALLQAGGDAFVIDRPAALREAHALVIPGVAHVGFVLDALDRMRLREPLAEAIRDGVPTLGICAGFQVLFAGSEEAPGRSGLGAFDGTVSRLQGEKIPHIGWNWVASLAGGVESGWAYFAHSFGARADSIDTIGLTTYAGGAFASIACKDNVTGVQFHPERSAAYGARFLQGFVESARGVRRVG